MTTVSFAVVAVGELRNSEPNTIFGVEIEIDIKPGSDDNPINTKAKGNGVTLVAILGSESFDVTTVDASTLAFGPGGTGFAHGDGHLEDVNGSAPGRAR